MNHTYLIALGGNVRHFEYGDPRKVIDAAVSVVALLGHCPAAAKTIDSAPLGPSHRRYANSAMVLQTEYAPQALLKALQSIERAWGQRRGQRWSARVLDLDIILWSGGLYASSNLSIPHPRFRERDFVLGPASAIAPHWHDPITNLSLRQLNARLTRPRPIPR